MTYRYYYFRRLGWWIRDLRVRFYRRVLTKAEIEILDRYFWYYKKLPERYKIEFRRKLEMILTNKTFVGRGGIADVTPEMEVLISATIVMVTFGWKRIRLPHFKKILIYPNTYYSTISKTYHRGEVNPQYGLIVVSWSCFLEGLLNVSDGVNLGIHEIAHALKLENQIYYNGESEFFEPQALKRFQILAFPEMNKVKIGIPSVLRPAAGINEHEFFAVAVETFFEKSAEFKSRLPEMYQVMVQLMRQDPLAWTVPNPATAGEEYPV